MEWKSVTQNDQGLIKIPKRWLHIHYYELLNILFRFENSLRVFVYVVMKNEFHANWAESSFLMPGMSQTTIKQIAARRISQADSFGYLGFDIKAPLMHLTSGELVELITADAYWPKFKSYFKGNKDIIKNKLLEIGTIRNSLAHFRPMRTEDVEVVKQNSRHTLLGVEECLQNIFQQRLRVPTNTNEIWYQQISTLGTQHITMTPYYSANEEWINVKLTFETPIIDKITYSDHFYDFRIIKINPSAILSMHSTIKDNVTYVSENIKYPVINDQLEIEISKEINLVFRKDLLIAHAENISRDLSNTLLKVTEECDLLLQDGLARGSLVEPVSVWSWFDPSADGKEGRWNHTYHELSRPYQAIDPDEYWGQHTFTSDVVAGCRRYPWMPEEISDYEGMLD